MAIHKLPRWAPMAGWTVFGHIFVKPGQEGVLPHEMVHVEQQRRDGWRFYVRYIFSSNWRVKYEAEAYAVDVGRGRLSLAYAAKLMSGPLYLWPCSVPEAEAAISQWLQN